MFQLDPMQLAIGAIFEMCDFFSPNKRKEIVGICTKMLDFRFSIHRLGSYQRIIIAFLIQFQNW